MNNLVDQKTENPQDVLISLPDGLAENGRVEEMERTADNPQGDDEVVTQESLESSRNESEAERRLREDAEREEAELDRLLLKSAEVERMLLEVIEKSAATNKAIRRDLDEMRGSIDRLNAYFAPLIEYI